MRRNRDALPPGVWAALRLMRFIAGSFNAMAVMALIFGIPLVLVGALAGLLQWYCLDVVLVGSGVAFVLGQAMLFVTAGTERAHRRAADGISDPRGDGCWRLFARNLFRLSSEACFVVGCLFAGGALMQGICGEVFLLNGAFALLHFLAAAALNRQSSEIKRRLEDENAGAVPEAPEQGE